MIHRRPPLLAAFWIACATVLVVIGVGPALWLLVISLQPAGANMTSPLHALDKGVTLDNFRQAWYGGDSAANTQPVLLRPLLNSVLVTFARALLNVLIAAAAASSSVPRPSRYATARRYVPSAFVSSSCEAFHRAKAFSRSCLKACGCEDFLPQVQPHPRLPQRSFQC